MKWFHLHLSKLNSMEQKLSVKKHRHTQYILVKDQTHASVSIKTDQCYAEFAKQTCGHTIKCCSANNPCQKCAASDHVEDECTAEREKCVHCSDEYIAYVKAGCLVDLEDLENLEMTWNLKWTWK